MFQRAGAARLALAVAWLALAAPVIGIPTAVAAGSPEARADENWADWCRLMADDLTGDYALTLPTRTFDDCLTLDLGDMTLILDYFGVGGHGEAGLVARIPELELLLFGRLLFHEQHLLPYLRARPWQDLNVRHTLNLLDEILADEAGAATVVVTSGRWALDEIKARRRYLGDLWEGARGAAARGATLAEAEEELSVDALLAYLKDWPVWRRQGAEWCGEEHQGNVALFWGQFQNYAAREIFRAFRGGGVEAGLAKYDELVGEKTGRFIVDDASFASLVEALFYDGYVEAADAVARRNAQRFPGAWPVQLHLRWGVSEAQGRSEPPGQPEPRAHPVEAGALPQEPAAGVHVPAQVGVVVEQPIGESIGLSGPAGAQVPLSRT